VLDYRLGDGLHAIECNPRCTPGALLRDRPALVAAILDAPLERAVMTAPGRSFEFGTLLLQQVLRNPRSLPRTIHDLLATPDAYGELDDPLPLLYRLVAVHHDERLAARTRRAYAEAFLGDLVWDPRLMLREFWS
jgi:hypothetical protein